MTFISDLQLENQRLKNFIYRVASIHDGPPNKKWFRDLGREARRILAQRAAEDDWSWQCNECGSDEYSSAVSEEDIDKLTCGRCGANEFHKVAMKEKQ